VKDLHGHLVSYRFLAASAVLLVLAALTGRAGSPTYLVTILEVVLILLALLLTYDAITRERDQKTLPLVLTQGVGRATVLLGKSLGALLALLIPLLLLALSSFASDPRPGQVDLADYATLRLAGLAALRAALLGPMVFLGLLISLVIPSASRALTFAVLAWLVLVVLGHALAPLAREGRAGAALLLVAGTSGLLLILCLRRFARYEPE